jgi:hypothetical protein
MTSIRKLTHAALLAVTSLTFAPGPASAQDQARGSFTLTHDVHWDNALVPAGTYRFSYNTNGVGGVLTLSKLDGPRAGFLFLASDTEEAKPADLSRLVLQSTADGSYVSAMQLPEFGMTLNFRVPSKPSEKRLARAVTAAQGAAR